ncbi:bacterio-opsin activator domain-containing protein [Natrononativus amylolyticus]|uniref:helix-turn-helix domain-containing protein n=1 Tax=Natrononativus amylolyticus TaxID=2963434 RepID=UPI0020CD5A7F|nr:bacterio-opsin activator domain-containing protein [Natrononativus amylolyticus]
MSNVTSEPTADGQITFDHVVATSDRAHLVYGTMTPDARATLDALADQAADLDSMTVISEADDRVRFEARFAELPLRSAVASRGGSVEEVRLEDGDLHLQFHLPPSVDVPALTETVHATYPTVQFLAKRQVPRPRDSVTQLRQSLYEDLTDRQRAVLEAAYHRGYFEWPRDASGEELADSLGIAPATFAQHLRKAEQVVVDSLLSSSLPA